ncbi:organic solute transporter Ostalpha-domain-containing protein [Phakopsora pachyrhizi]|nr:organic solute transporter Ostalpha-domain-containing protein [Phakopsora pachyrhizi]KAI8455677.1 organic solute transporter Ostalpha-domain-containing protein [Phakopsora pachyrhizi]
MTQRYPPLVSALVILSYHGFRLVEARKECPVENLEEVDHEGFFSHGIRVEWDAHRLGWASAGIATFIATVASLTNIYLHCSNYNKPLEQRQIIRILLMPTIYSLVSFFSYRYYREYVYFAVVRSAFVLAAFLILCLLYVGRSPLEQQKVMAQKEKSKLSFPFCCFRYRPSKPNFLIATKWSVLQYVLLRPLISAAAIVTDSLGVFCAASYHYSFANVWLLIITFVSATIALYGLLIIYHLAKEDLQGHRPLMKFMSIKIGVFLVFYQGFLISFLDHLGLIHPTTYWSKSNIADGINALATTIEMALIAVFQIFAFSYTEYKALIKGSEVDKKATPWKNFLHSQDYRDFARDIRVGSKFFFNKLRGKARLNVRDPKDETNDLDFQRAVSFIQL